jgi:four helix bundle protein
MKIKSYRDLEVWQKAIDVVEECYQITKAFPNDEKFGLASQLQRAAVSVPSNIAEGRGRHHTKEFLHHLAISNGSLAELETQLIIGQRLGYFGLKKLDQLLNKTAEIGKMINGLRKSLRNRD